MRTATASVLFVSLIAISPSAAAQGDASEGGLIGGKTRGTNLRQLARERAWTELVRIVEAKGHPSEPDVLPLYAQGLFELRRYPDCERALRELLRQTREPEARLPWLVQLAEVCRRQRDETSAVATIEEALGTERSPPILRTAAQVYLQAQNFERALLCFEELKPTGEDDARFWRGLAASRLGRYEQALRDFGAMYSAPHFSRDARYEGALIYSKLKQPRAALKLLRPLLEVNPYDSEAVFLASRLLLRVATSPSRKTAAHLARYFEMLRTIEGESSEDHHLEARGQSTEATLMRAERWKRLGAYDRVLQELDRLPRHLAQQPEIRLYRAELWFEFGLLTACERELQNLDGRNTPARVESNGSTTPGRVKSRRDELKAACQATRRRVQDAPSSRETILRRRLVELPWREALPTLEQLLTEYAMRGASDRAQHTARVLLAHPMPSRVALEFSIEATQATELIVPHLHFAVRRLAIEKPPAGLDQRVTLLRQRLEGH